METNRTALATLSHSDAVRQAKDQGDWGSHRIMEQVQKESTRLGRNAYPSSLGILA